MGEHVLTGIFAARADAEAAVQALRDGGVADGAVRVFPEAVRRAGDVGVRPATRLAEGASLGALTGAAAGALAGALGAGGALVVPGLGMVLAGPSVAALACGGAAGALGLVVGALVGARRIHFEAAWLEDALSDGGALVVVRCAPHWAEALEDTLSARGALAVRRQR